MLHLQPISFRDAAAFVDEHHRHHKAPQGYKFAIAANDGTTIVGVVMTGRPVSRHLDDEYTLEVTRCCTTGTPNTSSFLYAAAWRAARAMGYHRLITYTLSSEPGTSLIATGFKLLYQTRNQSWDRSSRPRLDKSPLQQKSLWELRDA